MEHFVWGTDPVALSFGSVRVFWYGIFFASAILSGLQFIKWVYKREGKSDESMDALFTYAVIGIVVGARLGHCFFYDPAYYLANPLKIIAVWEGGLASHGGGIGFIIALWFYVRKYKMNFIWLLDRATMPTAIFAFFVRMGNFMNSEIVGTKSELPWAIVFSRVDEFARHPAQVYEAISYLAIFFLLTYLYKTRTSLKPGILFGVFLTTVFSARFLIEFVKTKQAAYSTEIALSTGQLLSIPFLIIGVGFIIWSYKK
ncbi:prolipoprotein diacylglyceryl transferase [Sulfurimonas aquatica]|uniref:Phosphatidylglycerol--prolipoprotein diacylglyceryl transferase n=1 Tax=Sulfurimonas aquatica TaxID=2672570 RepID=A0A975AZB0_9BACT|nr:prolipoprotein diacylglyceryl transferase [Sulfurimonas aquatica]QSZ41337.1 prolipoprotein diacylglyceryl transferase [Sulfurimonas aquatica]